MVWVAIDIHSELQILSASAWYCTTPLVAYGQWFEVQSMHTPSCKDWVLPPDNVTPLQLQSDSGSGCNRGELQIMSASAWYYSTSVATGQCFELQSMYTLSCKYWVFKDFHLVSGLHYIFFFFDNIVISLPSLSAAAISHRWPTSRSAWVYDVASSKSKLWRIMLSAIFASSGTK
jgi:hypothetical protein